MENKLYRLFLDDSRSVPMVYESGLDLRNLRFYVHSANPVASEHIKSLLNNYQKFLRENPGE